MPRVLIVDDEAEIVDFLENFLKRFKIESYKAYNGKDALAFYEKNKPDCVFLDIKIPDKDGLEVLRELQKTAGKPLVIMITGRDDKESQDKAKKLGAIDYIIKPLDLEQLHQKVNAHILGN
jgi:DNA-binding response OmpR family regulator